MCTSVTQLDERVIAFAVADRSMSWEPIQLYRAKGLCQDIMQSGCKGYGGALVAWLLLTLCMHK